MRAFLLAVLAAAPLGASARSKLAVLDVRAVQGVQPGTATILTAIVVDDAARAGFDVISQADVSAMIGFEKQKKMLGCSEDSSCLAEIGGALGVDHVLSGQVGQIGSRYHLSFQLLDAKKARVVGRAARFAERDEDALAAAAQALVAELLAAMPRPGATVAKTTTPTSTATPTPTSTSTSTPTSTKTPAASPAKSAAASKADLSARPAATVATDAPRRPFRPGKLLAWGTVGTGAVLLLAGASAGAKAKAARDAIADAWQDPNYASIYDTKSAEAKRNARTANALYVLGAATTGLGGWFVWRNRTLPLAVAPVGGDGELGLVAAGSF